MIGEEWGKAGRRRVGIKFRAEFRQFHNLIAYISGTKPDIMDWKTELQTTF